jgi:AcrR family transcriptional regulator
MTTSHTGRPLRRNAAANRQRILAAAEAVFGAHGALGSTEDVAAQAGVGIATVFRHYATKEALIEAALLRHFDRLHEQADTLGAHADPADALQQLLARMIDTGATKLTLASRVGARGELPPNVRAAAEDLRRAMNVVLDRAKTAGVVRAGVTVDEVYVLIRGLAQATATMPPPPATLSGAIDIIWRGIARSR